MNIGFIAVTGTIANEIIIPTTHAIPKIIKIIAPTKSCFQEIPNIINNIIDGKLCKNNAKIISPTLVAESKTSNEKITKNKAKIRSNILGVQNIKLLIFFIIYI